VLERHGVAVPDDVRDRILECTDISQLGTWLDCAITTSTADDVIHGFELAEQPPASEVAPHETRRAR
jgi:hypothetical protein